MLFKFFSLIYAQILETNQLTLLKDLEKNIHNFNLNRFPQTTKQKFMLLQHFGAPTRILDFTKSPYIATYFAIVDNNNYKYSAIYAIDVVKLWGLLDKIEVNNAPKYVSKMASNKNTLLYCKMNIDETFYDLVLQNNQNKKFVAPINPDYHDERTIPQASSFFTYSDLNFSFLENLFEIIQKNPTHSPFYKIIFPSNIRMQALRDLNLMNISHASLFPNLEGFISGLKYNHQIFEYEYLNNT